MSDAIVKKDIGSLCLFVCFCEHLEYYQSGTSIILSVVLYTIKVLKIKFMLSIQSEKWKMSFHVENMTYPLNSQQLFMNFKEKEMAGSVLGS